jgi:uncharacterized protein
LWQSLLAESSAILRAQSRLVAAAVSRRRTMRIAGHVVPVANCPPELASEVGNRLCEQPECKRCGGSGFTGPETGYGGVCSECGGQQYEGPPVLFAATYHDGPDRRHFSLRSPEGGADVGEIAKKMAKQFNIYADRSSYSLNAFIDKQWTGGGHTHAASFDAPFGWNGE